MLTIMGIALIGAGIVWLLTNWRGRQADRRGWSLGELEATCDLLGDEIGWDLRDRSQRELFLTSYQQKVRSSQLPPSAEWEREIFDRQHSLGQDLEDTRRTGITLWYLLGELECPKLQAALLEYLYRLYLAWHKPTQGLREELGFRAGLPSTG